MQNTFLAFSQGHAKINIAMHITWYRFVFQCRTASKWHPWAYCADSVAELGNWENLTGRKSSMASAAHSRNEAINTWALQLRFVCKTFQSQVRHVCLPYDDTWPVTLVMLMTLPMQNVPLLTWAASSVIGSGKGCSTFCSSSNFHWLLLLVVTFSEHNTPQAASLSPKPCFLPLLSACEVSEA